ncbi:hypothetical protein M011DRAFT_469452 [Sporormia fimetaria CBS 119925]|uniref:Uncharacterized protein n=1 Tax=Sporormia fimetaria CBS 119925 TaxID=1340428 RepID=A0A6A6V4H5_9PLEO|nr:hypothetical protein M011DRAFT_469452 [Sporormia fimetaria CBS 119925]
MARERASAASSSSATTSDRSTESSRSSVVNERENCRPSGSSRLKKARSWRSIKRLPSDTIHRADVLNVASFTPNRNLNIEAIRDPKLHPAWTYAASLSPTLPSGASLDPSGSLVSGQRSEVSSPVTSYSDFCGSSKHRYTFNHDEKLIKIQKSAGGAVDFQGTPQYSQKPTKYST